MGLTLSEPATAKDTACCENAVFKVGSSCMQGWRIKMEDAHTHILSLPDDPGTAFFAVYDGHGGAKVAEYAGKHLHKHVAQRDEFKEGRIEDAMRAAFLEIDEIMQSEECLKDEQAGTTAVVVVVKDKVLYCANAGDSRAVASVQGRPEPLSWDHKPNNTGELNRIIAAGGFVEYNRVNGNLALSRALGDYVFKRNVKVPAEQQIVTANPDVERRTITDEWEFIVLACDGIWDVMSSKEVVDYVREQIAMGLEPEDICESLMMKCLAPDCHMAGLGCDNMTVVIVALLNGGTYDQLSLRCASKAVDVSDEWNDGVGKLYPSDDQVHQAMADDDNTKNSGDVDHRVNVENMEADNDVSERVEENENVLFVTNGCPDDAVDDTKLEEDNVTVDQ